ncbi:hypothetical protein GCM10008022_40790 [Paenibacillus hunanensis]|nr:hypothetical protein GCM10008022_40790 [Paenibacillus hunanensis]
MHVGTPIIGFNSIVLMQANSQYSTITQVKASTIAIMEAVKPSLDGFNRSVKDLRFTHSIL